VNLADVVTAKYTGLEDELKQSKGGGTYESPNPNVALAWLSVI